MDIGVKDYCKHALFCVPVADFKIVCEQNETRLLMEIFYLDLKQRSHWSVIYSWG